MTRPQPFNRLRLVHRFVRVAALFNFLLLATNYPPLREPFTRALRAARLLDIAVYWLLGSTALLLMALLGLAFLLATGREHEGPRPLLIDTALVSAWLIALMLAVASTGPVF